MAQLRLMNYVVHLKKYAVDSYLLMIHVVVMVATVVWYRMSHLGYRMYLAHVWQGLYSRWWSIIPFNLTRTSHQGFTITLHKYGVSFHFSDSK